MFDDIKWTGKRTVLCNYFVSEQLIMFQPLFKWPTNDKKKTKPWFSNKFCVRYFWPLA